MIWFGPNRWSLAQARAPRFIQHRLKGAPDGGVFGQHVGQASQAQPTTVAPGWRWLTHPAALAPGWLAQPARLAAWARLPVLGWLVSSLMQRQVRLSLRTHAQQVLGHPGTTAAPTAAGGGGLVCPGRLGALLARRRRGRAGVGGPAPSSADL